MVFPQPPHPIPLFYIIASPAQLWSAGTRAFKFQSWPRSSKSFWQEAVSTVRGTGFGALGANAFRPLGRDLGMPKGSRGGTWAIRPSVVLLKLFARRWLECFGAVPAGRQFIAETAQRMVQ